MTKKSVALYLASIGILLVITLGWFMYAFLSQPQVESADLNIQPTETFFPALQSTSINIQTPTVSTPDLSTDSIPFDGDHAYEDVKTQVAFGPRIVGSQGHADVEEWIRGELVGAGWQVEVQESEALGHPVKNIVARRSNDSPQIIIGAHYDTRMYADHDPDPNKSFDPVPGANDGASGVAVLLELARTLPDDDLNTWLVFFDTEDNGQIAGWDWILGSREFVKKNQLQPRAVVVVDMIGDADLNIYKDRNSNTTLTDQIWGVAAGLGYEQNFIPNYKYSMLDDHTPFNESNIPAVDIIDFDYPYWHTTQDTADKVSVASLEIVGKTLWAWITEQSRQ